MDSMKHDITPNDTKPESDTLTEAAIFHQIQSNIIEYIFFRTKNSHGELVEPSMNRVHVCGKKMA